MNLHQLPGIYESEKIETIEDGKPTNETVQPGIFTFTRDNRLSVVSASNQTVMAYVGSYRTEGEILKIQIDSCVFREMEGTEITRRILKLNETHLILEVVSLKSKTRSVLTWRRKISL